jgi:hypothetical protein
MKIEAQEHDPAHTLIQTLRAYAPYISNPDFPT